MHHRFVLHLLILFFAGEAYSSSNCTDSTVRILSWNLLNFPSQGNITDDTTARLPCYRTVLAHVNPDIVVTQENSASNSISIFLSSVLNQDGSQYSAGTFINGDDTDNGIFYRTSCFRFISNVPVHTALRDVNQFTLVHEVSGDTIRIFSCHLKASSGSANEALRAAEADSVRKATNAFLPGTDFILCGDFNFYGSAEPAYQRLLQVDSASAGHFADPLALSGIWNNPSYSIHHTQSPRTRTFGGGATGGLDDRFDLFLFSSSVMQQGRITYQDGSLTAVGNDGFHYGDSINHPPNSAVPQNVADALHCGADHLPVYADFIFSPVIGVEELAEVDGSIHLYPNPSRDGVMLSCMMHVSGNIQVIIYDQLGRIVKKIPQETVSAGMYDKSIVGNGELKPGNYFVRVTSGLGTAFSSLFTIE